ncbi:MAG TPA: NAD(P)-dependent oxidoreductase [Caldilineaceae bacterium]|nr:NAD(P)-dependent oxidoreductase [Caldilineaceae bacterium]
MSSKLNVLLDPHTRRIDEIFSTADQARLHEVAEIQWGHDDPMPLAEAAAALATVDAVICAKWRYGDALYHAPKLRAILTVSGGFPLDFDYDYCFDRRIRVLSVAPAFGPQVAEMALGMAIAAARDLVGGDRAMRAGNEHYLHKGNIGNFSLYHQPVGFIGYGGLAKALQPLLTPFGCTIGVYDPWLGRGYLARQGVVPMDLDTLLTTSRFIFVLAVPSEENRALLSREKLALIPQDAVFVLISRAHVVDFDALTELVMAGRFRAAIDVFPQEPLDPMHPIRHAEHAILSAHRAGSVREQMWLLGEMVVDDLEAIALGMPPRRLQVAEPELVARYRSNSVTEFRP